MKRWFALLPLAYFVVACAEPKASEEATETSVKPSPDTLAKHSREGDASTKTHYKKLSIDSVEQKGSAAVITGSTDLPDGAKVNVDIDLYSADPNSTYVGNSAEMTVDKGIWGGTVDFPKVAAFSKGPHEATAMFTPRGQSPEVISAVGSNGENLTGSTVGNEFGLKTMHVAHRVQFEVARPTLRIPSPETFKPNDPRRALATLLADWKHHNWKHMAAEGTLPEDSTLVERAQDVDNQFGFRDLESANIGSFDVHGRVARINVEVSCAMGSDLKTDTMGFVLLNLDRHAQSTRWSQWRVNLEAVSNGAINLNDD